MMKKKILVTGGGAPGAAGIIKSLLKKKYNVHACDANIFSTGKLFVKKFHQIPKADSPFFLKKLLQICLENKINIIIPLVTKELEILALNKKKFEEKKIQILVNDYQKLKIINNKFLLYEYFKNIKDVKIPSYFEFTSYKSLNNQIKKLKYPKKKVVIKPSVSNGSRGLRIIDSVFSLEDFFLEKNSIYQTNLKSIKYLFNNNKLPSMIAVKYLSGKEYTVDTVSKNGVPFIILIRSRDKINSGISTAGTFVRNKSIENQTKKIIKLLKLSGPIGLQFKDDDFKNPFLLEINPRLQGTSVSSNGLGINLPDIAIKSLFYDKIKENKKKFGVSFLRFYEEKYFNSISKNKKK
jgi:carbamoyl-phosphate synthase large subunit